MNMNDKIYTNRKTINTYISTVIFIKLKLSFSIPAHFILKIDNFDYF